MSNKTAIKSVIQNQMQEFAKQLASKYTSVNETEALTMANALVENLEVKIPRRSQVDDGKPRFYKQTGYSIYVKEIRDTVLRENPGCKFGELSAKIGQKWKALSKDEQTVFNEKAKLMPPVLVKAKKANSNEPRYKVVSGYNLFSKEIRPTILKDNPGIKFGEVSSKVSAIWKAMTEDEHNEWNTKAKALPPTLVKPKANADESGPKFKQISGYMLFCKETRNSIATEFPKLSFIEIGQKLSSKWQGYTQIEKDIWNDKAKALPPVEIKVRKNKKSTKTNVTIKKPYSAFKLFLTEHFANVKIDLEKNSSNVTSDDIKKTIADMWKTLSKEQKKPYTDEAAKLKAEYNAKLASIKESSPSNTDVSTTQQTTEQSSEDTESDEDDEKDPNIDAINNELNQMELNDKSNDDEADENDEQEVETTPVTINNVTYYLDQDTTNLYNEDGEFVGTYKNGVISN